MSRPRKYVAPEDAHQAAVIQWHWLAMREWPELKRLFHVPNGGHRNRIVAAKLVGQGVKRGVPDLWLPVRRRGYTGCVIEMKRADGGDGGTPEQLDWLGYLEAGGWYARMCNGATPAIETLRYYLQLPKEAP